MSLLNLTNEIVVFIAQIVAIVFPLGITIYAVQSKNMKILPRVAERGHGRLSSKIIKLFFAGAITIFYVIFIKIIIFQFILSDCILWCLLSVAILLLLLTFFFVYSILPEIGLVDE